MMNAEILALAERVERATGPDRELECRAWLAVKSPGASFNVAQLVVPDLSQWQAPAYTASLDAAMLLVPPNWDWSTGTADQGKDGHAFLKACDNPSARVLMAIEVDAFTPALALVAACLRAIAAGEG